MSLGCLVPDAFSLMPLPGCLIPDASSRCLLLDASSQMPLPRCLDLEKKHCLGFCLLLDASSQMPLPRCLHLEKKTLFGVSRWCHKGLQNRSPKPVSCREFAHIAIHMAWWRLSSKTFRKINSKQELSHFSLEVLQ